MNCKVIKFKHRNPSEASNKYLAAIYTNGPKYDIALIASDRKTVLAHKHIVYMFSDYLKDYLREFKPKGKAYGEYSMENVFLSKCSLWIIVWCELIFIVPNPHQIFINSSVERDFVVRVEASG